MAKSQEDGIAILLGLKDHKVEQVREDATNRVKAAESD